MDTLELKKYHRKNGLVDESTTSPESLLDKIKSIFGHDALIKNKRSKRPAEFYEFFINGQALSTILTAFYELEHSLLDRWVGALGSFANRQFELNTIKRLLLKAITEQEIRSVFPKDLDQRLVENGIENYKAELADEEITVYVCAECGDYGCGGYKVKVDKMDDAIVWTCRNDGKILQFYFDINQYHTTFDAYRETIEDEKGSFK